MNQEQVNRDLSERMDSKFQGDVVTFVNNCLAEAATEVDGFMLSWESADMIYRGYRMLDKKDVDAKSKKEPPKIIIPVSYALTQTALSFLMTTFFSDERLFRLLASGPEDARIKEGFELDINWQLSKTRAYAKIYLWLQDAFKYGVGIVKSRWKEENKLFRTYKRVEQPGSFLNPMIAALGLRPPQDKVSIVETTERLKTFEGTEVINVSPYCFYPDPSVPMSRFQDGAYVGHEEETTRAALRSEEGYCYYGTQHIPDYLPAGLYSARPHRVGKFSLFKDLPQSASLPGTDIPLRDGVIKTEIEFTMTASQLKEKFSYDLGPEYAKHDAVKMVAVVANEQKVIKFEPCGYLHGQYSYDVIEYSPDHNNFVNPGISDTVHNLQEIMTWFLNSHIQNVRKSIKNRFIGDPSKIHVEDLTNGNEFVRTKDMMGKTIKDVVYSMETNDVTRGHVADIQVLNSLIQVVTGINENALGQYATGRRSATEARSVTSAAGARLKMHGMIAWVMGIEPLGQKLIANTNQLRSREFYEMIIGEDIEKYPYEKTIVAPPHLIAGGFNFMPYEGTLPNDKERHAGHFVELFKSVMSNPQAMVALTKLDLNKVLNHIFSLYGVKNFSDFILAPEQLNQDLQTSVLPDLAVEELKNQGQLQRVSMPNEVME